MEEENKLRRVLALMICVLAMCTAMFYLPDKVFDYPIKKVDFRISLFGLTYLSPKQTFSSHEKSNASGIL